MGKEFQTNRKSFRVIKIKGGKPFEILIPFSGVYEHNGTHSLWQVLCPDETIEAIKSYGGVVEVYEETQSAEQREERLALQNNDPDRYLLTPKCPECIWFDPTRDHEQMCQWISADLEYKKSLLSLHSKALEDLDSCPRFKD